MAKKKPAEVDIETCASCRFFLLDDPKSDAGLCRRFPPVIIPDEEGVSVTQPASFKVDWCGEYKRVLN